MRRFIGFMLVVQLFLLACGCYELANGQIGFGLWNVIVNGIFIPVNLLNLRDARP